MADTGGIRAGRAYVELGVNDQIAAGLARARARLAAFGRSVRSFGANLSAVSASAFAGGAAVTGTLAAAVRSFVKQGSDLQDMAQRTGMSVESLSELGYAAEQTGSSLGAVEKGVRRMQRSIYDAQTGLTTAVDALNALGMTASDLEGLSPDKQFDKMTAALAGIKDPSERAALAMVLFGRAGTELLPTLDAANGGLDKLRAAARDLGLTISGPAAAAAHVLGDAFTDVSRVAKATAFAIGAALSPVVLNAAKSLTAYGVRVAKWVQDNRAVVVAAGLAAAAFTGIAGAIMSIGVALIATAPVFGLLASGVGLVGAALGTLLSPVGLVVGAIGGAAVAFATLTEAGRKSVRWLGESFGWLSGVAQTRFGELARTARTTWAGLTDALQVGDIETAVAVAMAGANAAWLAGVSQMQSAWLWLKEGVQVSAVTIWSGLQKSWASAADWMWSNFPKLTEFIVVTWANVVAAMKSAFMGLTVVVRDVAYKIAKLLGMDVKPRQQSADEINAEAESRQKAAQRHYGRTMEWHAVSTLGRPKEFFDRKAVADFEYSEAVKQIETERLTKLADLAKLPESERPRDYKAEIEAERKAAIAQARERAAGGGPSLESELAEIEAEKDKAIQAIIEANANTAGASLDALADAQAKLRAAVAQAKLFRESAEGWARAEAAKPPPMPDMGDIEQAVSKMTVQGTFLASSVGGLAGSSTLTRIASASERTARASEATAAGIQAIGENEA